MHARRGAVFELRWRSRRGRRAICRSPLERDGRAASARRSPSRAGRAQSLRARRCSRGPHRAPVLRATSAQRRSTQTVALLARLGRRSPLPGPLARDGQPLGADAEAAHLRADRRASSPRRRTSLPEQLGGERNWDYRYTWIRDAAFSLYALLRLGFTEEAAAFMDWLTDRIARVGRRRRAGRSRSCTASTAAPSSPRSELDAPRGLPRLAPGADRQRGGRPAPARHLRRADRLGLPLQQVRHADLPRRAGSAMRRIVDWLCENWDSADEGIWETRGGRQDFTYSRLMCWVAIERAIRIAAQRGLPGDIVALARRARRDLPPDHGTRLERGAAGVRPALRLRRARRVGAADAAREVHRAHRPALAVDARRDRRGARLRQPRLPLQRRGVARRPARRRGHVLDLLVLVRRGARARRAGWTRRGSRSRRCSPTRTTSGSTPRRSARPGEALGNFPQAFTHLALISAAVQPRPRARLIRAHHGLQWLIVGSSVLVQQM